MRSSAAKSKDLAISGDLKILFSCSDATAETQQRNEFHCVKLNYVKPILNARKDGVIQKVTTEEIMQSERGGGIR